MRGALHGVQNIRQRRAWLRAHAHEKNGGKYPPPKHRLRHSQYLRDKTPHDKQSKVKSHDRPS